MSKGKFTWEEFRGKAIAVRCLTECDAVAFLMHCKKQGFIWDSGAKIQPQKQTYYPVNGSLTCYIARADFPRIGYRSFEWACGNGFLVIDSHDAITAICEGTGCINVDTDKGERVGRSKPLPYGDDAACGDKAAPEIHTHHHARWRDAESDKPIKDGEYIVCYTKVEDCEFCRCVERVEYDLANGWDYIEDAVITHWLDGVPELPEVVVR